MHRWVLPTALARVTFRAKGRLANGKLVGTSRSTAPDQMRLLAGAGDEAAQQGRAARARPCARTRLRRRDQYGILSAGADRELFRPRPFARTARDERRGGGGARGRSEVGRAHGGTPGTNEH